jgi:phospholipid/cholesterol/gamma-HCH transport system ATP-binding protein
MMPTSPVIEISNLVTRFGNNVVHDKLSLTVDRGEIFAIVGGSGSGKTTLLRDILMLERPSEGSIKVFGQEIVTDETFDKNSIRRRWGVMFQFGALFSGLTILENVAFPLHEFTGLSASTIKDIAMLKMQLANFPTKSANLYPSELSGGMVKRAAIARAIAMDPELLFLDEPTSGLDPESAGDFDELVLQLQENLGLTIVMITHDMDTLCRVPDRIAFLGDKRVLAVGSVQELLHSQEPLVQQYFGSPRAHTAMATLSEGQA